MIRLRLPAALAVLLVAGLAVAGCGSSDGGDSTAAQGSDTSPESSFQNSDGGQASTGPWIAVMQIRNETQFTLEFSNSRFNPRPRAVSPADRIAPRSTASTRIEWEGSPDTHFVAVLDYKAQDAGKTLGEISSQVQLDDTYGSWSASNRAEVKQGPFVVKWANDGQDPRTPRGFTAWVTVTSK